jgi:putative FmdB family regulatory protein
MPIYEYRCKKCGAGFEHLARTLSALAPNCPKCGAAKPQKQFSVFSAGSAQHNHDAEPCADGACPSAGACASGKCPFN